MTINYDIKFPACRRHLQGDVPFLIRNTFTAPLYDETLDILYDIGLSRYSKVFAPFHTPGEVNSIRNQLITAKIYEEASPN
jgi:hypothetical protein